MPRGAGLGDSSTSGDCRLPASPPWSRGFWGCSAGPRHSRTPNPGIAAALSPSLPSGWRLPQPGHGSSPRPWEWEVERLYFKPPLWVGDLEKQLREQECEVQPPPLRAGPSSTG